MQLESAHHSSAFLRDFGPAVMLRGSTEYAVDDELDFQSYAFPGSGGDGAWFASGVLATNGASTQSFSSGAFGFGQAV